MKIKKYIAPTMPEVMKKIRSDLGKDAVILNSKEIRTGGLFGFFTKPSLEVIAAHDPDPVSTDREKVVDRYPDSTSSSPPHFEEKKTNMNRVGNNDVQQLIKELSKQSNNTSHLPDEIQEVDRLLKEQGVNNQITGSISKQLLRKWYQEESEQDASRNVMRWLNEILLDTLPEVDFGGFQYDKKFINLIGPTGVGKTTTIAKIAADAVLNRKKKAAMITTDTYRIAAIEQLKTYAEILNLPLEVAYNHDDFQKAKEKFKDYDVILVDSAGRNFKNSQYIEDLEQVYHFDEEMENYLVLSLTSKYSDMRKIVKQFENVPISRLVFTKKDETDSYGDILNLIHETNLGVAYITIGQNVPDDIKEASSRQIIDLLIGDGQHA